MTRNITNKQCNKESTYIKLEWNPIAVLVWNTHCRLCSYRSEYCISKYCWHNGRLNTIQLSRTLCLSQHTVGSFHALHSSFSFVFVAACKWRHVQTLKYYKENEKRESKERKKVEVPLIRVERVKEIEWYSGLVAVFTVILPAE